MKDYRKELLEEHIPNMKIVVASPDGHPYGYLPKDPNMMPVSLSRRLRKPLEHLLEEMGEDAPFVHRTRRGRR
jgi:hypothetical protein